MTPPTPQEVAQLVAELNDNSCTSLRCTHHPCHLFRRAADALESLTLGRERVLASLAKCTCVCKYVDEIRAALEDQR